MIEITGSSIPENSLKFYKPLISWVKQYVQKPNSTTNVKVFLDYYNTTSSKFIFEILKNLEVIKTQVTVKWFYYTDEEEMLSAGEEYQSLLKLRFEIIEQDPDEMN